ncbi:hypothetical protein SCLCIDRAFT_66796, partial [Scleroderma citrinum Foug A]
RAEIVHWVSKSQQPFEIVGDRRFLSLMKMAGRPGYHLPHPRTVARDVRQVFSRTKQWIAEMLQKYDRKLSFTTDVWTVPNH